VFRDKRGELVDDAGEAALWGNLLEEPVAREWARRQRSVVQRVGLIAHVDEPWRMATLDRQVLECPMDRSVKTRCALEVKCRSAYKAHRFKHGTVPDDVFAQVAWQLSVTGYDHIHTAVLIGGNELRMGVVEHEQAVDNYILAEVRKFREEHLLAGVEPAWDLSKAQALIDMDSLMHPERVGELDLSEIGEVIEYAERSAVKGAAEKALKESSATLRRLAVGARVVKFADELAYEFSDVTRKTVDTDQLKARWPEAYEACVTEKTHQQIRIAAAFRQTTPGGNK
jgi:predicted phage-related endonuclease